MDTEYREEIMSGRAYVRLIEAADTLLATPLTARDRYAVERAREVSKSNLRELVATLSPDLTAQILAIGENIVGPTGDVLQN